MAIRGAFSAGLVKGFAESMEKSIDERKARMNQLIDNQMDTVRRTAPKIAKSMAEAKNAQMIMGEMKAQFGVTDEEFIALAQSYDINQVYGAIQKAQANLPEGAKIDKSQFLGSLNIPKGTSLPEGMTAEQALESIYLGYARNISEKPDDKSEVHRAKSWGKALKDTLMLDPRASAEEQLEAMSYMGIPVQEVLQYEASQGVGYQPLPGAQRVQGFDIDVTDYKERDYMSTANTYERTFTRTFAGTDDLANVTDMAGALKAIGAEDEAELGNRLRKGGTAIADLELGLSQAGVQSKLERDRTLLRLSNEVNTSAEMDNLISAVENGTAEELILESMQKNGRLTNDYIEYILTGTMPTEEDQIVEDPTITPEPDDLEQAVVAQEGDAEPAEVSTGDATVDAILNNAPAEDDEGETEETGNKSVQQRLDENQDNLRAAMASVTKEEWQNMSRSEREEAGLPVRPLDMRFAGADAFKGNELPSTTEAPEGSIAAKEYESAAEFIQDNDQRILDELESKGLTGESSKDEIKRALTDFYRANQDDPTIGNYIANAPMQDIDRIADVFMLTLKQLEEQE